MRKIFWWIVIIGIVVVCNHMNSTTNITSYPPYRAENGDLRGADNDKDGRSEPVYVRGYYRKDGTYVRGHYRARARQ